MPKKCPECDITFTSRRKYCPECVREKDALLEEETDEVLFELNKSLKEIEDGKMADSETPDHEVVEQEQEAAKQELLAAKQAAAKAESDKQKLVAEVEKVKSARLEAAKVAAGKLKEAKALLAKATAEANTARVEAENAAKEAARLKAEVTKEDPATSKLDLLMSKLDLTLDTMNKLVGAVANGKQDGGAEGAPAPGASGINAPTDNNTPPGVDEHRGGQYGDVQHNAHHSPDYYGGGFMDGRGGYHGNAQQWRGGYRPPYPGHQGFHARRPQDAHQQDHPQGGWSQQQQQRQQQPWYGQQYPGGTGQSGCCRSQEVELSMFDYRRFLPVSERKKQLHIKTCEELWNFHNCLLRELLWMGEDVTGFVDHMNYMSEMAATDIYDIRALVGYDEEFLELARHWGPCVFRGADTKLTNSKLGVSGTKAAMAAKDAQKGGGQNHTRGRGGYRGNYGRGNYSGNNQPNNQVKVLSGWRKTAADKNICFKFCQHVHCDGCQFKHMCVYCDSTGHAMNECPKQQGDNRA